MRRVFPWVLGLVLAGCFLTGKDDTAGDDGAGVGDDGGGDDGGGANVPDNAYCSSVADWPSASSSLEDAVVARVNQHRSQGADCGNQGSFGPTHDLRHNGALRCAARVHSQDMATRGFFDHVNPDGEDPFVRIEQAGYRNMRTAGENIAAGSRTAEMVVDSQWMTSPGHCANIMSPDFDEIGVGYAEANDELGTYWTQTFGSRF